MKIYDLNFKEVLEKIFATILCAIFLAIVAACGLRVNNFEKAAYVFSLPAKPAVILAGGR